MTSLSSVRRWLELLARGDLSGGFEPEGDPEQRRILELLRQAQDQWMRERQETLTQMVSDINQTVELKVREQKHLRTQAKLGEQLHHAERLAAIGRLASGVAHEINNPLTIVVGNLDTVSEMVSEPGTVCEERKAELLEILEEMEHGAERIRRIVIDLQQFAQDELADNSTVVDLSEVMDASIRTVRNQLRHRARVITRYGDCRLALGSELRLQQVFVNLLLNAVQAMDEHQPRPPQIEVSIGSGRPGELVVRVADNGQGISPDDLVRIFDPFFTTRDIGEGTGLGLSVSQGLVKAMGGRLEVRSEVGQGTVFMVVLPAATQPSARSAALGRPTESPANKILVVDDEPGIIQVLRRILDHHDVTTVTSGLGALDLLRHDADFDVVLCDLMMPELSGMQLYERIKAQDPDLAGRFVFMTGGAFYPEAQEFVARNERPCLDKPFDRHRLLQTIGQVLPPAS